MSTSVNLLPLACRKKFEHWRQARRWIVKLVAVVVVLMAGQAYLKLQCIALQQQVQAEEQNVAPLLIAESKIQQIQATLELNRRHQAHCQVMEQSHVPLALLQIVSQCCYAIGPSVELESLRMDEATIAAAAPGQVPVAKKQLYLSGKADGDARVTALVGKLRASKSFAQVELEASQATSDQQSSNRTFQIRCQQ